MLDSWGCVTHENYNDKVERTNMYKPLLLKMATLVNTELLKYQRHVDSNFKWFIADGTLLGAYRDGRMITHDYDFDFGIYYSRDKLVQLHGYLEEQLKDTNYKCKLVESYSYKIEIYDPSHGVHSDVAPGFYNVIMDLQLYADDPDREDLVRLQYFRETNKVTNEYKKVWVMNTGTIKFEGYWFPCVSNPEAFLTVTYGYIGPDAVYDKDSGKYVPRTGCD